MLNHRIALAAVLGLAIFTSLPAYSDDNQGGPHGQTESVAQEWHYFIPGDNRAGLGQDHNQETAADQGLHPGWANDKNANETGAGRKQELSFSYQTAPAIPEAENYALIMAGLAVVGVLARRRNRA